ncbi:hypothetical protein [Nostoc sp. DSM 114160]
MQRRFVFQLRSLRPQDTRPDAKLMPNVHTPSRCSTPKGWLGKLPVVPV